MKRLCIIPARAGSKRIPNKNLKDFLGKPIMAYSILTALNSNLFDEVIVSTDSKEISDIASKYGAGTPFIRSEKNSNDYATTFDVIREVLSFYDKKGIQFEEACCLYATAPLTTTMKLHQALRLLNSKNFITVFPVIRYGTAIQRAMTKNLDNRMQLLQPEYELVRSQDIEPSFHDAGQFYFFKVKQTLICGKLYTENTGILEISENEGQDIDSEIDWQLAELKYKLINNQE